MSEFNIFYIKNKIFNSVIKKPQIYVHYEDDIFIVTQCHNEINKLKQTLEKNSVQKFTTEVNINFEKSSS